MNNECVYLPDHGLFVTRDPAPTSLAAYKKKIAGRKTILEEVRELPDQTFAQAMAKTHHDAQREGPVLLSLACDNAKFIVERDGTVRFQPSAQIGDDWSATAGEVRPLSGNGQPGKLTRHLEGGWLPIPVIAVEKEGVVYRQRTFVAPGDSAGHEPGRLNRRSVCVIEFTVTNTQPGSTQATLALAFLANSRQKQSARITPCPRGFIVSTEDRPLALVDSSGAAPLRAVMAEGTISFSGTLAGQETARCTVYLPGAGVLPEEVASLSGAEQLRLETERYWKAVLAPAMQVETPDELLNNAIRSSQIRCLIDARNEADGARIAPWIAAMSYGPLESEAHSVIRGMDFMGHTEFARRGLEFFIHRYNTNGFLTTGYTTFGTAWHLWTLGEHFQLNRDTNWWKRVAPEVARVGQWIVRQTEKTKRPPSQFSPSGEQGRQRAVSGVSGRFKDPRPAQKRKNAFQEPANGGATFLSPNSRASATRMSPLQVHGPDARPKLEIDAAHEPSLRSGVSAERPARPRNSGTGSRLAHALRLQPDRRFLPPFSC
ncbi:MAG: hypothetical protein HY674_18735 [Chloroflexi bacterium]|nr:hypothetical protein [Chloroflexota bacterium]